MSGQLTVRVASGDAFDVRQFSVHERISSLFSIQLVALSDDPDIDFEAIVGHQACFLMTTGRDERLWSGICNCLQQIGVEEDKGLSTYKLTIVPLLWLATQRRNYRIFQQISEPDIALKMLEDWDIEPEVKLTATYRKRKYRVQYGESDFAFLSRMLEDAGISFYFKQADGDTKLVLSDASVWNEPRAEKIAFRDHPTVASEKEHVTAVRIVRQLRPGRYTLRDHDYRKQPGCKLIASAEVLEGGIEAKLERYHYVPGAFLFGSEAGDDTPVADDKGKTRAHIQEAEILARKRMEAKRASTRVCELETNAHDLSPGSVISILDHPKSELSPEKKLLIVQSTISGTSYGEWTHRCEARSADIPYRPALSTRKPRVNGVESATVVGPPGEEIHCDEFGRVRVHFHWDREGTMDDKSSCWIHVSQPWGGAGYGAMNLPRVGQEVLVSFLGGENSRERLTWTVAP